LSFSKSFAVFTNRISRFSFSALGSGEAAPAASTAFAAVPAFASAGSHGPNADIYRLAQEQALQQVAARRERARRSHEWN
jgi:hypothetical protein